MAVLGEEAWALGDGASEFVFGAGTPLLVDDLVIGDYEVRADDTDAVEEDTTIPGLDTHGGRSLTIDLSTNGVGRDAALAWWEAFAHAWDARTTRLTPRGVVWLRWRPPAAAEGEEVAFLGRPRKLTPSKLGLIEDGVVHLVATFETVGKEIWGPARERILTLNPDLSGGLTIPYTPPFTLAPISTSDADVVLNDGAYPSWPVITLEGPVGQPRVRWAGSTRELRYDGVLGAGQTLTIDTSPHARTVLLDGLSAPGGAVSGDMLADFFLPVGPTTVAYRGSDPTGSSTCTIRWRPGRARI